MSVPAFEPAIAHAKKKIYVIARIPIAETRIGEVRDRTFEENRAVRLYEYIAAEGDARREIDLRSVARRNIGSGEDDAANRGDIGRKFLGAGEIPLPDHRPNAAAPYRAGRRENDVHGQDVRGPLKIPAEKSREEFRGKDDASAPAGVAELVAAGMAQASASAGQKPELDGVLTQGLVHPVAVVGIAARRSPRPGAPPGGGPHVCPRR